MTCTSGHICPNEGRMSSVSILQSLGSSKLTWRFSESVENTLVLRDPAECVAIIQDFQWRVVQVFKLMEVC